MDKEKKQQVILIILIPVFLAGLLYMRSQQDQNRDKTIPGLNTGISKPDSSIDSIPSPKPIERYEYVPSGKDPFTNMLQAYLYTMQKVRPEEETTFPMPKLTIEGIIWNTQIPQAIVNGQVVRIGDTIEGVKIEKIEKQGITIDHNGRLVLIGR
jgi:hypothetical protein